MIRGVRPTGVALTPGAAVAEAWLGLIGVGTTVMRVAGCCAAGDSAVAGGNRIGVGVGTTAD